MPSPKRQRQREGRAARQAALAAQQRRRRRRTTAIRSAVIVAVVAIILAAAGVFSSNSGGKKKATTTTTAGPAGPPPTAPPVPAGAKITTWTCPNLDGSSARTDSFPATPPPMCIDPAKTYTAHFDTSEGAVDMTLDTKATPQTANNFAVLSLYHYYDGTSIDRIDNSIDILQSGSPRTQSISDPGPGYTIPDEGGKFKYADGDVVMARGQAANSGASQYFFVVGSKASSLDAQGTYVTFGHITAGLDVLHKIEGLFVACPPSSPTCLGGLPSHVVTIKTVTIKAS